MTHHASICFVSIVKIRKWFPPHDPLAAKIARLCILREDLLLEMEGVYTEDIDALDSHSAEFRRMFFLRNLVRTQIELSGAIQVLLKNEEFILLKGVSEEERRKITSSKWETIAELVPAFGLIERCVLIYLQDRKLLP